MRVLTDIQRWVQRIKTEAATATRRACKQRCQPSWFQAVEDLPFSSTSFLILFGNSVIAVDHLLLIPARVRPDQRSLVVLIYSLVTTVAPSNRALNTCSIKGAKHLLKP